jgi:hypothetical protein
MTALALAPDVLCVACDATITLASEETADLGR